MRRKMQFQKSIQSSAHSCNYAATARGIVLAAIGAGALACGGVPGGDASEEAVVSTSQALEAFLPNTRRSIQDLPASDRKALADAILAFITQPVLDEHASHHDWHHLPGSALFFTGHHGYLNELETYLKANGFRRFIPLPMWKPNTPIPAEFLVLDPLVQRGGPLNANPNQQIPADLVNVCSQPYATLDALAAAVVPWHNTVHTVIGGVMGDASISPGAPIFWLWHGFLDDMYHQYQSCTTPREDVTANLAPADGNYGTWRSTVYCPPGEYATSFRMRVEGNQGSGDDTSLNSVELECKAPHGTSSVRISSHNGFWGSWGATAACNNSSPKALNNFLNGARLRVEAPQGSGDDTGANDATFTCTNGNVINPGGSRGIGSWSNYATCPADSSICGISTRVEAPQGSGDDTAMNGLRLSCCKKPVWNGCRGSGTFVCSSAANASYFATTRAALPTRPVAARSMLAGRIAPLRPRVRWRTR